jgi:PAS domain S-box-containing protein
MPPLIPELVNKILLFIAVITLNGLLETVYQKIRLQDGQRQIARGLLFGVFAVIDIFSPIPIAQGVILGGRNVLIAVVSLFSGALPALIVTVMVSVARGLLGGAGALPAVMGAFTMMLAGLTFRALLRRYPRLPFGALALALGVVVAVLTLAWFLPLPPELRWNSIAQAAPPVVIVFPLATGLLSVLLRQQQQHLQADFSLSAERQMLRTLIDNVPDYIFVKDAQKRFIASNTAHADGVGLSVEALMGRSARDLYPTELAAQYEADDALVLKGTSIIAEERQTINADGQRIYVTTTKVPLRDADGRIVGVIGVSRDVTRRKQVENALRESEQRYRTLIDNLLEGIVVQRTDGTITDCNASAERILGLTAEQMMGRTSIDPRWRAVHEDGSAFPGETHPSMVALTTGEPQHNVVMGVHKPDGTLTWILVNAQPLRRSDAEKPYAVIASFLDITQRKADERQMLALAAEQQRTEALQHFINDVSHDIRTPLSILSMNLEMLRRDPSPPRIDKMEMQLDRITRLLDDFVELSELDSALKPFVFEPVAVGDVLQPTVIEYQQVMSKRGQQLTLVCADDLPSVRADQERLRRALANLLHNAVSYTPENGHITARAQAEGAQVVIAIQDDGIGMTAEEQTHIFERFYRADSARSLVTGGSGLGLVIVQRIIEAHDGTISVQSAPGQGSTFTVRLPAVSDESPK